MGFCARPNRWFGLGSHGRRWGSVASLDEGSLATYERLVCPSIGDFRMSFNILGLEEMCRHRGLGLDSVCIRSALLRCWQNRAEGGNLELRPR